MLLVRDVLQSHEQMVLEVVLLLSMLHRLQLAQRRFIIVPLCTSVPLRLHRRR